MKLIIPTFAAKKSIMHDLRMTTDMPATIQVSDGFLLFSNSIIDRIMKRDSQGWGRFSLQYFENNEADQQLVSHVTNNYTFLLRLLFKTAPVSNTVRLHENRYPALSKAKLFFQGAGLAPQDQPDLYRFILSNSMSLVRNFERNIFFSSNKNERFINFNSNIVGCQNNLASGQLHERILLPPSESTGSAAQMRRRASEMKSYYSYYRDYTKLELFDGSNTDQANGKGSISALPLRVDPTSVFINTGAFIKAIRDNTLRTIKTFDQLRTITDKKSTERRFNEGFSHTARAFGYQQNSLASDRYNIRPADTYYSEHSETNEYISYSEQALAEKNMSVNANLIERHSSAFNTIPNKNENIENKHSVYDAVDQSRTEMFYNTPEHAEGENSESSSANANTTSAEGGSGNTFNNDVFSRISQQNNYIENKYILSERTDAMRSETFYNTTELAGDGGLEGISRQSTAAERATSSSMTLNNVDYNRVSQQNVYIENKYSVSERKDIRRSDTFYVAQSNANAAERTDSKAAASYAQHRDIDFLSLLPKMYAIQSTLHAKGITPAQMIYLTTEARKNELLYERHVKILRNCVDTDNSKSKRTIEKQITEPASVVSFVPPVFIDKFGGKSTFGKLDWKEFGYTADGGLPKKGKKNFRRNPAIEHTNGRIAYSDVDGSDGLSVNAFYGGELVSSEDMPDGRVRLSEYSLGVSDLLSAHDPEYQQAAEAASTDFLKNSEEEVRRREAQQFFNSYDRLFGAEDAASANSTFRGAVRGSIVASAPVFREQDITFDTRGQEKHGAGVAPTASNNNVTAQVDSEGEIKLTSDSYLDKRTINKITNDVVEQIQDRIDRERRRFGI